MADSEIKIRETLEALEKRVANAERQLTMAKGEMLRWPDGDWRAKLAATDCVNWHRQIVFLERMIEIKRKLL